MKQWSIICMISVILCTGTYAQQMIIDHRAVDEFDYIPGRYIDSVKNMIIQYIGENHGRQVPRGLQLLAAADPVFAVQIGTDPSMLIIPNALTVIRTYARNTNSWSGNTKIGEVRYWATEYGRQLTETTLDLAAREGNPFTVSLWCWCWDICSANYCSDENWSLINTRRNIMMWSGNHLYLRHPDYDEDIGISYREGHCNEALCIRKAKALWVTPAKIAGWEGNVLHK
ncbi:MAG: hypothetical protein GF401_00100 [Chitinivibrionales bacterium]|nr:hypothetical protein [Chitinivibrionales bacterium]